MSATFGRGNVELGEQFNFSASYAWVHMEFSRDRNEIFLKYLQRHNSRPGTPMLRHEFEGPPLFCWRCLVIRINENIGIEEATNAHESRLD